MLSEDIRYCYNNNNNNKQANKFKYLITSNKMRKIFEDPINSLLNIIMFSSSVFQTNVIIGYIADASVIVVGISLVVENYSKRTRKKKNKKMQSTDKYLHIITNRFIFTIISNRRSKALLLKFL